MKRLRILIGFLVFMNVFPSLCHAQTKKNIQKNVVAPVEKTITPVNELFEQMLPATAKVMFVDSFITDKSTFLEKIPLISEVGSIVHSSKITRAGETGQTFAYLNEYGNKSYFAQASSDSTTLLFTADLLDKQWSTPKQLDEVNSEVDNPNYPFLLADGTTLYFAAEGEKSMGGYDIFMTIYDSESGSFYSPQNIGLPFNSTANDYLYAIDETNQLGWLVSDRNQEEGKVCVYTFVPTEVRQSYEADNLPKDRLKSMAQIRQIADTWAFGDRNEAMNRLAAVSIQRQAASSEQVNTFVVNDQFVYLHADDFESAEARKDFLQLNELTEMLAREKNEIDDLRSKYHSAGTKEKADMKEQILKKERNIEQLYRETAQLRKGIRNKEIMFVNKKNP